jgi:hypothetical protein
METKRNRRAGLAAAFAVCLGVLAGQSSMASAAVPQAQQPPKYGVAEFNGWKAASDQKDPKQKIAMLDAWVAKYPTSELLSYAYKDYMGAYYELHQWNKYIEYLDKFLALPVPQGERIQALYQRAATFDFVYNAKSPNLAEASTKARDSALEGLKALNDFAKPAQATDEQWAAFKKQYSTQFYNTAATSSFYLKDYKAAADNFHALLGLDPKQAAAQYMMGRAYLLETPPQTMAGFWAVARAIALKVPDADKVTNFLRDRISDYQSPVCDSAVDGELKELLALAQNSDNPPADYSIPSTAELAKLREREVPAVIASLRANGKDGKNTWVSVCDGVFPEAFLAKIYEINATDPAAIEIKAAVGSTEDEVNASTAPDLDLFVPGQPNAARLGKDDIFRFAGKMTGYSPNPFQITFKEVKINPEDIPEEKGKKPAKRPGKAKP